MKQLSQWVVVGAVCAVLAGCGFELRSVAQDSPKVAVPTAVMINNKIQHRPLEPILAHKLRLLGFTADPQSAITPHIRLENVALKSHRLVGVLTEIRMVLTATAHYHLPNGQVHTAPLLVERSYQYNENDVSTSDRQAVQVQNWLYESLATRVSEQYATLYKGNPQHNNKQTQGQH